MSRPQDLMGDLFLRVAGLGLVSIAMFAAHYLYALVHPGLVHQASPLEFAIAAIAFLGASAGLTLCTLGRHIFDQVEISARWAWRPGEVHPSVDQIAQT